MYQPAPAANSVRTGFCATTCSTTHPTATIQSRLRAAAVPAQAQIAERPCRACTRRGTRTCTCCTCTCAACIARFGRLGNEKFRRCPLREESIGGRRLRQWTARRSQRRVGVATQANPAFNGPAAARLTDLPRDAGRDVDRALQADPVPEFVEQQKELLRFADTKRWDENTAADSNAGVHQVQQIGLATAQRLSNRACVRRLGDEHGRMKPADARCGRFTAKRSRITPF